MDDDVYDTDDSFNQSSYSPDEDDRGWNFLDEDYHDKKIGYFGEINLTKLKSLREQLNWENEEERYPFYFRLTDLLETWKGYLPDLEDIFRREEIDWLLMEAAINRRKTVSNKRGQFFIEFVHRTGYEDEPELNEDGKPSFHRTTAVHRVEDKIDSEWIVRNLFKIYNRFDVNYTDESGYTHFHAACQFGSADVVEKFLELGQDPNCLWTETGDSPLHLALILGCDHTTKLLLRSGADPNLANKEGLRPLHIICKRARHMTRDLAKLFFKINDEQHQTILIDAKDGMGRTPLQLAVASLLPDAVDVLLDRGADLSSFVFPVENYFGEIRERDRYDKSQTSYLDLVYSAVAVVERLEKRGYELDRRDALTIMKYFDKFEFFKKPVDLVELFHGSKAFVLYNYMGLPPDWIQLPPEEVEKKIKKFDKCYFDYSVFIDNPECETHLAEMMARRLLRLWALEPLVELTRHYQLPILCCDIIIKQLKNQDLMNICFAVMDKGEA